MKRLLLAVAALCWATTALAQSQLPPAIPQIRNQPAAARLAQDFPAVNPAPLRAPGLADNTLRGYVAGDSWLDPWGQTWTARATTQSADSTNTYGLWTVNVPQPPTRPMDGQTAAKGLWGVKRLITSYVGNALQLRDGANPGTVQDIAFLQNDEIDARTADQFCTPVWAAGAACEIATVYNQGSGGATCDITAANGTSPVWDASKTLNGRRVISHQSIRLPVTNGPPAVNQFFTIPAGCTFTPNDMTWLMVGMQAISGSASDAYGLLSNDTGTFGWSQTFNDGQGLRGTGFAGTMSTHLPTSPSVFAVGASNVNFRIWINGNFESVAHPNNPPGVSAGGFIGNDLSSTDRGAIMEWSAFAIWTSQLSSVATPPAPIIAFEAAFNVQRQFDNIVVINGASDGTGIGTNIGSNWPLEMVAQNLLTPGVLVFNNSSSGTSLTSQIPRLPNLLTQVYSSARGATARNFIAIETVLGNDIRAGQTSAQIIANLQAYVTFAKTLDPRIKVLLATKTYACDYVGSEVTVLQQVNDWIKTYTTTAQPVGAGADGFIDQFDNVLTGNQGYSSSLMCSTVRSWDGVHLPDPYFQASGAAIAAKDINQLLQ